jgi:hypothetical protein
MPTWAAIGPLRVMSGEGDVRDCLDAVQIERAIDQGQHGRADDGGIFRTAARHHHIDRQDFARERAPARRNFALYELRLAAKDGHERVDLVLGVGEPRRPRLQRQGPSCRWAKPTSSGAARNH